MLSDIYLFASVHADASKSGDALVNVQIRRLLAAASPGEKPASKADMKELLSSALSKVFNIRIHLSLICTYLFLFTHIVNGCVGASSFPRFQLQPEATTLRTDSLY